MQSTLDAFQAMNPGEQQRVVAIAEALIEVLSQIVEAAEDEYRRTA